MSTEQLLDEILSLLDSRSAELVQQLAADAATTNAKIDSLMALLGKTTFIAQASAVATSLIFGYCLWKAWWYSKNHKDYY